MTYDPNATGQHVTDRHAGRPFASRFVAIFIVPYSACLACIYLTAYWRPLGINAFHYTNAADLTTATLGGLAVTIGVGGLLVLLTVMFNNVTERRAGDPLPTSKVGRFLVNNERYAIYAVLTWTVGSSF